MAQAIKTVEIPFETLLTTLATNTTLGTATVHTFTAVTLGLPESSKTIRCAYIEVTHQLAATTTARRLDGVRIGVQIDAVAFNDVDLTGTGIAQSGDPYSACMTRDVTSYFVTNYTGTSHTVGARVAFEHDVADTVNNITCKLYVTYEYDDTSATQVKTVKIPLEGNTGFLGTTANADQRGTAGAAQIPLLNTWLPEDTKTFRKIWFECYATSGGAATTDFNVNYSIDAGTTATRATLEQGLNGSSKFFDIWVQDSLDTSAVHDFEAWSSLASRFECFAVIMHVTYEFALSSTTTVMNSLMIPIRSNAGFLQGTSATDRDFFETELWIEEPATITIKQSAAICHYSINGGSNVSFIAEGSGAAGGSQTTVRTYTGTTGVHAGSRSFIHRLDLAHGGTALTLGRGLNKIRAKVYSSTAAATCGFGGYFIINYTSGKSSQGIGKHNVTTHWMLGDFITGTMAGTATREIATTNQRTPNIPQTNYLLNSVATEVQSNSTSNGWTTVLAERTTGDGLEDGWVLIDTFSQQNHGEFGWHTYICTGKENWKYHPNDVGIDGSVLNIETARKQRIYASITQQTSTKRVITTHGITFTASGEITGSAGGTVTIGLYDYLTGEKVAETSRTGNGSYTLTWYDNTRTMFTEARESGTLLGRSDSATLSGTA